MGAITKIAQLVVDIEGNTAKLREDMRAATGIVKSSVDDIQARMNAMKSGMDAVVSPIKSITNMLGPLAAGFGTILSLNAFGSMVRGAADAAEKVHDLAAKTGASVESLSALASVGKMTDTSLDTIAGTMNKLSKNMATADEDGKGAAAAIKALGIDFDSFRKMSPDQQMLTVAKAMDNFADGGGKSAAAMALMGKEGAAMIPFMKDLAAVGELNAKMTAEQAAMADNFNDNMVRIKGTNEAWKKQVSMSMLPAMDELAQAWFDSTKGANGLNAKIKGLADDGSLTEWARGAVTAFTYLVDVGQGLLTLIPMIGKAIAGVVAMNVSAYGALGDAWSKLKSGDMSGAWDAMKRGASEVKNIAVDVGSDISKLWNQELLGEKIRKGMADVRAARAEMTKEEKPQVDLTPPKEKEDDKALKAMAAAYDSLIRSIREKINIQEQERASDVTLTEGQKLAAKVMVDLRDGVLKLKDTDKQYLATLLEKMMAEEQSTAIHKEMIRLSAELIKSGSDQIKVLDTQLEAERAHNEEIGLSKQQLVELAASKLQLAAAVDEELAKNMRAAAEYAGPLHDAYLQYARDLDEAAEKKRSLASVKLSNAGKQAIVDEAQAASEEFKRTADDINKYLGKAIMNGFTGTKGFITDFTNGLKGLFSKLILQPILQPLSSGIASVMGFGGGQASGLGGVGSIASGLSGVTSGLSNLYSLFTGGAQSAFNSFALSNMGMNLGLSSSLSSASTIGVGQLSGLGSTGQLGLTGMGQVGSSIAAAAPWVAAALAAYSIGTAAFGHGERQITGQNVTANVSSSGISGTKNVSHTKSGGWLSSDINGQWNYDLNTGNTVADGVTYNDWTGSTQKAGKAIKAGFDSLLSSTMDFSKSLGLNADAIIEKTYSLKFDFGSTDAEFMTNLTSALAGVADTMAQDLLPSIAKLRLEGESAGDAFKRLGIETSLVDARVKDLGLTFSGSGFDKDTSQFFKLDTSQLIEAKDRLVQLTGGAQAFSDATAYFAANFLTKAEQMQPTIDQVTKGMADLGYANITTVEQFKNLVRSIDGSSEAGATLLSKLMALMPGFKTVADYTDSLGTSATASAAAIAQTNKALQDQIDAMLFSSMTLEQQHAKQLEGQDESTQSMYRRLWALQAEQKATTDAAAAIEAANQKMAAVASERYGLETQWLQLTGQSEELHKREMDLLAPANRDLAEKIYLEQKRQAAEEKSAQIAQQVAQEQQQASQAAQQAAQQLAQAWQSVTDSILSEVSRLRGASVSGGSDAYAAAQAKFTITNAAAAAGDMDAAKLLPQLSQTLDTLAKQNAGSALELARIRAMTANSLEQTALSYQKFGVKVPGFAGGGDFGGGLRLVGENGPELEATGASRIYNAEKTQSLLGGNNAELVAEVRALRKELEGLRIESKESAKAIATSSDKTARILSRNETPDGIKVKSGVTA
ncbi:hypothetical protein [Undibacterium sp. CY21W]|uniref:hypothetical protein n=1 Tax=Undibacterium sp. CY21W TaxID=2762293 RepID=UPI00164C7002|nr:hypothetical protein [Undibacterium sp. CY21W]MBC3927772.1 hypothetical protein [Undibacterium sp. CY21W]